MTHDLRIENLNRILSLAESGEGMDIIVVSTSNKQLEKYWQERLMETVPILYGRPLPVIVIAEEWSGGAGNGLGTLYAIEAARKKGEELFQLDLLKRMEQGRAVALYHTAGKGTRLAPLPICESNNKSGVRLPATLTNGEKTYSLTILEAVIKQTALYGKSRKERLSVFWGDQIFVPSVEADYTPSHHADLLVKERPVPSKTEWNKENLHLYGVVGCDSRGDARQVEKIDGTTMERLVNEKRLHTSGGFGVSLGCFSLSLPLTKALLEEFAPELEAREGSLDSDPHFWMAMTLDEPLYLEMRGSKDPEALLKPHYERMQRFRKRFVRDHRDHGLLGMVDVGHDCFWWDYGTIAAYCNNHLKLTERSPESAAMRKFYGLPAKPDHSTDTLDVDGCSQLIDCDIKSGRIDASVLVGVKADHVEVEDCVLLNCTAPSIKGCDSLFYNMNDDAPVDTPEGSVRADLYLSSQKKRVAITTAKDRNGSEDWETCLPGNDFSYQKLHELNDKAEKEIQHS